MAGDLDRFAVDGGLEQFLEYLETKNGDFLKYLGSRDPTSITTKIAHNLTHERHNFVQKTCTTQHLLHTTLT